METGKFIGTLFQSRDMMHLQHLQTTSFAEHKALGAYYVLGALTIVNETAATSLPWLFQSFSYF